MLVEQAARWFGRWQAVVRRPAWCLPTARSGAIHTTTDDAARLGEPKEERCNRKTANHLGIIHQESGSPIRIRKWHRGCGHRIFAEAKTLTEPEVTILQLDWGASNRVPWPVSLHGQGPSGFL